MTLDNGPLALALARLVGVIAQTMGRHARVPAIVLLLGAGVGLGPDGADVIRPAAMANALPALVGFAVAIIVASSSMATRRTLHSSREHLAQCSTLRTRSR